MGFLQQNNTLWNKKLIKVYWWIFLIYEVAATISTIVAYFITPEIWIEELLRYQVLPTILQLGVMGLGYWGFLKWKKYADYIMIIWGSVFPSVYILTIPELYNKYEILIFSIILSITYFQRKKVLFSTILSLSMILILFLVNVYRGTIISPYDIIVSMAVVVSVAFVCHAVLTKGLMILHQLQGSVHREQELLVRSTLMDRLSKVDALTDLLNHRSFQEHTDYMLNHHSDDVSIYLALLDIDNFKKVNDTFGHAAGDVALKKVADKIKEIEGPDDISFRYGGEEFAILFIDKKKEQVIEQCERLLETIRSDKIEELENQNVTVSIGLAEYQEGTKKEQWFKLADDCLYSAKRHGKDRLVTLKDTTPTSFQI